MTPSTSTSPHGLVDLMIDSTDYSRVQDFVIREAELLDERKFGEWNQLFTEDGLYWVPLDAERDPAEEWSLIYDNALRREERVYHLTEVPFPSQSPESRTLHVIGNLRVSTDEDGRFAVVSNQIIYEVRVGDFRQVGLGEQRSFAGKVEYLLEHRQEDFRIARKVVHLLNRGTPIGNLTFIL